jgi:hypothetical protein
MNITKSLGPGRQVESSCEFGNEPSGPIKSWETIEWPDNWCPRGSTELVMFLKTLGDLISAMAKEWGSTLKASTWYILCVI